MILVVGSTGVLGNEICRRLIDTGKPVRGLVRSTSDAEKVAGLKAMGVETVLGDLRDPDLLAEACRGVEAVITTATSVRSMQPGDSIPVTDQQGQLNLAQAARQAGVRKFVYISYLQKMESCPLTTAKRTVEQAVKASGMDYTILCPAYFMEAWFSPVVGFDITNAKATIYGDGHAKNSYSSRNDVAEYAVQSLDNSAARNTVFELAHPEAYSQLEAVRLFEQASGKAFELQFVPIAALEAQRKSATDPLPVSFAALMHTLASGIHGDTSKAQKAFPDIQLKSVKEFSQDILIALPRGA
jgi:NADH dehydrogenase